MRDLNEKHVYDLSELTNEELREVLLWLKYNDGDWIDCPFEEMIQYQKTDRLCFNGINWGWDHTTKKPTANAKELFYTLENVQVDCSNETEERIKEMADVFEKSGFDMGSLYKTGNFCYLNDNNNNFCFVGEYFDNKTTITYEKFMELFGSEESNFKNLVEVLNEELTEEAYKETEYEVKYIAEKPQHYAKGIDTFARMEANCTTEECLAFAKGNIDKYNFRTKGQDLEDYKKIVSYANWAISLLNKE